MSKQLLEIIVCTLCCLFYFPLTKAEQSGDWLAGYNPCWITQSRNASESMPCGGGDVGMNVWVENNEVLFYLSRSGVFDENNVFPKLGRVRLNFSPDPFEGAKFRQELKLRGGYVEIEAVKEGRKTTIQIWADVFKPVVEVNVKSDQSLTMTATYENWRTEPLVWNEEGRIRASLAYRAAPVKAVIQPDSIRLEKNAVLWYHRNREKTVFDLTVEQQQLETVKSQLWNPLKYLTFGGYIKGDGMVSDGTCTGRYVDTDFKGFRLKSKTPARIHRLNVMFHTAQTETLDEWQKGLNETVKEYDAQAKKEKTRTREWWNEFWNRSHVVINADSASASSPSWQVGRNYQLFRYQLACNAYGKTPTKFNGGLFTFDPSLVSENFPFTPDHRDWGGGTHTAQNQRLVYWPMLKNGDADMLKPQLDFYLNSLVNAEQRVKHYWGHEGACFTEQIEWFGLPMAGSYGWNRSPFLHPGIQHNLWVDYEWDTVFEFCLMALNMQRFTGKEIREYLPLVEKCLTFYDQHYQMLAKQRSVNALDEKGKLILYPSTGCETYKMAFNSANTIGALKCVTRNLLELPTGYLSEEQRKHWEAFEQRIPDLPIRYRDGHRTLAPALAWERVFNYEIPQLYSVFPWGLYGIGRPDLETAINTWKYGVDKENQRGYISWHQDAIFCARLGLTEEAKEITLKKMTDSPRRYPTFWGPGHDWVPDHNWGGSGMIGVQEMLMQVVDEKIYLLPAWPKNWDVDFKLHAPGNTTVECSVKDGKIRRLTVIPEARKKDVVVQQQPETYQNPVIPGFYPDPSTIRVGTDYYTINSTFQYFPALAISHSKDLVNWEQAGYVFNDENPIDLTHFYDGCGLWAPDISYYNGEFYVFYCLVQLKKDRSVNVRGNYMTKSRSIHGPWSKPVQLTDYGSDPSHFVDDDGEHYMLFAAGIPTGNGTCIVKLNKECTKVVEGPFWMETEGKKAAPEGPHLMKKDDYYYFMMAASAGAYDGHHQLLARSKKVYGPYEMCPHNPFVAQFDDGALNKHQGHGKMFQTQGGDWYITLITQRRDETMKEKSYTNRGFSQLGRETSLYPVKWGKDGWPKVCDQSGLPDVQPFPRLPYTPLKTQQSDDFSSARIGIQWLNVRNPIYEERNLTERKGWLRFYTGNFTLDDIQARNILVQRETSKQYTVTTKLEFHPQSAEQAGLLCYYDSKTYASLSLRKEGENGLKLVLEEQRGREKVKKVTAETKGISSNLIYLRMNVNNLHREFFYSYDGTQWSSAGKIECAYYLSDEGTPEWGFMGTMVGVYALNYGTGVRIPADFDEFIMQ